MLGLDALNMKPGWLMSRPAGMQLAFDRAPNVRYGDPCDVCTVVGIQHMVVVWTVYSGNECRWGLQRILSPDDRDKELRLIRQKVAQQINGPHQPVGTAERALALVGAVLLVVAIFTYTFGEAKIKRIARDGWSRLSDPQSFLEQFAQSGDDF